MRLAKPLAQHAIFGNAIEHAVGADDRGVHRAGEDQRADDDDKAVKEQAGEERPFQVHGQAADQIFEEALAHVVGNDHHREKRNQRGEHQAVDENYQARLFEDSGAWGFRFRDTPARAILRRSWPARNVPAR